MAKMKGYEVVIADGALLLESKVNSALGEGFELVGGVALDRNVNTGVVQYCQAIAKPTRAPKRKTT